MRKHILILGHNYATQFIDICNQYTRLFDKEKYEVTVAYLTGSADAHVKQRTIAEHVIFFDFAKTDIRYLKIRPIRTLLRFCREKQVQLAICHRYKPSYIMMWVARFYQLPALICVMHELRTMVSRGRQLLIAALARRNNVLFAGVSNAVRDDMRKNLWFMPPEKVVTLYNMIDVDLTEPQLFSRSEARAKLGFHEADFIFGNVARLVRNKDQATLIEAFAAIKPYCPQAKLAILGSGDLEAPLKAQAKARGLEHDIIFCGHVANGFCYMKAFDCFVLTSTQEAFGRVLLEAMIAKLPIIASAVHGIPEVVKKAGILLAPRDQFGFAQAMQRIYALTHTDRQQQGEFAYQHAVTHFSIPRFHEQCWQLPVLASLRGAQRRSDPEPNTTKISSPES